MKFFAVFSQLFFIKLKNNGKKSKKVVCCRNYGYTEQNEDPVSQ